MKTTFAIILLCFLHGTLSSPIGEEIKAPVAEANDVASSIQTLHTIDDPQKVDDVDIFVPTNVKYNQTAQPVNLVQSPVNIQPNTDDTTFKPQYVGTTFARLIDDIFQIPITVLQSVAKLLTNPFKQPETQ